MNCLKENSYCSPLLELWWPTLWNSSSSIKKRCWRLCLSICECSLETATITTTIEKRSQEALFCTCGAGKFCFRFIKLVIVVCGSYGQLERSVSLVESSTAVRLYSADAWINSNGNSSQRKKFMRINLRPVPYKPGISEVPASAFHPSKLRSYRPTPQAHSCLRVTPTHWTYALA